ncbi:MAG: ATP-grasp domain-containing protein [Egibacteraceae bacterium]
MTEGTAVTADPEPPKLDDPYLAIIVEAAHDRGIAVEVIDREYGFLRLKYQRRTMLIRGSLPELTSAVAMSRCDNKHVTHRVLAAAGLRVPRSTLAAFDASDDRFLAEVGNVVVKPIRGEGGTAVTIGVTTTAELARALAQARVHDSRVLLEEFVAGHDLRVVVIDHTVVAAAIRRPATVTGDGHSTIRQLIQTYSAAIQARSNGELRLPLDKHTEDTVQAAGYALDDVLGNRLELAVRRTANVHTGGTMHDVTDRLHPHLAEVCVQASRALDIPVVGLDLVVQSAETAEHVFIEANERPGLANHEPQPVAERFIDLLFPETTDT